MSAPDASPVPPSPVSPSGAPSGAPAPGAADRPAARIRVDSEVGRLRRVVIQPPGVAHERMLPSHIDESSPDYVLFDDLIHVPTARAEHAWLRRVLASVAETHALEDLVAEVLQEDSARRAVLDRLANLGLVADPALRRLEHLDPVALTATLIAGTEAGRLDGWPLMRPLPNLIFTRDLLAVCGGLVVVGNASKAARRRESVLTWAMVQNHPLFAGAPVARVSERVGAARHSAPLTVEGGDVLVISSTLVCIGASERTTWSMIVHLAEELLESGFSRVLVVEMPKQRSSMHLDTVFTLTDRNSCVVYPPLLRPASREEAGIMRLRRRDGHTVVEELPGSLLAALASEGIGLEAVLCGGGHPIHAQREQWTDGANYVALGPGVVLGYARNRHTAAAMAESGFEDVTPEQWLALLDRDFGGDADALFASGRRVAIHLAGSELCRGRGGPRCLTMPLARDPLPA